VFSHHILLNKGEGKNVGGVVGHLGKRIALIHIKSQPPILILTNHVRGLTKQNIIIQSNPNRPTNYIIVSTQAIFTHATSYDVLVGGKVFIPFKGYFKLIRKNDISLMVDRKKPYGFVAN
jgi:hypothetical protein